MKPLVNYCRNCVGSRAKAYFEGLLDADFDTDDNVIIDELVKKATNIKFDHDMPDDRVEGEWVIFDCARCGKDICLLSFDPFKHAGYSKYRFINCTDIDLAYLGKTIGSVWTGIEIDAPESEVHFSCNDRALVLENVKLNSKSLYIEADNSEEMKITMKGCKFDVAFIKIHAVTQLSISDTCKFTNCKALYLGRVGKSVARKAFNLLMGDIRNGISFKEEVQYWRFADETKYWDIDVMKTLSLKDNKWPDLGKIVIVPNGIPANSAPGICLYKPGKTMLPLSGSPNGESVEFKGGWKGQHVKRARTELNCVTK